MKITWLITLMVILVNGVNAMAKNKMTVTILADESHPPYS